MKEPSMSKQNKDLKGGLFTTIIRTLFMILLSIFLYFGYVSFNGPVKTLLSNSFVFIIVTGLVIGLILFLITKITKLLETKRFGFLVMSLVNIALIFFFIYQLFTPYFYSSEMLEQTGAEAIRTYYQLSDDTLSETKREELVTSAVSDSLATSMLITEHYPTAKLKEIDIQTLERNFYLFDLTVSIETEENSSTKNELYQFVFTSERGQFKINSIMTLDNN
ncbi:hypothetical protein SAMN05421839_11170 [Halolactibacillus halophilus]|uniref:Uncharacterized protein n=1 Tax=Halolactibacillus halophilus TaxID=306540 RepID=A0A1I5NYE9_9BACI|nr:hypothetical protein [Halolactibacillus halophilus]GEM01487.1 hypothetical protein HHA03_10190 [Halolactibacillus halophilus]SFP26326.1 hypothetical protein SAMN05421839_11170 [Halolactibacillus halophilus]